MPVWAAAVVCNSPKSELAEVSDPVTATPIQPTTGERKAKNAPVAASARPRVTVWPEKFITYARASTATTVRMVHRNCTITPISAPNALLADNR